MGRGEHFVTIFIRVARYKRGGELLSKTIEKRNDNAIIREALNKARSIPCSLRAAGCLPVGVSIGRQQVYSPGRDSFDLILETKGLDAGSKCINTLLSLKSQ